MKYIIFLDANFSFNFDSNLDEDITSLANFTPEHLVRCVSKCLRLIQPDLNVPDNLPPGNFNIKFSFKLFYTLLFTPEQAIGCK